MSALPILPPGDSDLSPTAKYLPSGLKRTENAKALCVKVRINVTSSDRLAASVLCSTDHKDTPRPELGFSSGEVAGGSEGGRKSLICLERTDGVAIDSDATEVVGIA